MSNSMSYYQQEEGFHLELEEKSNNINENNVNILPWGKSHTNYKAYLASIVSTLIIVMIVIAYSPKSISDGFSSTLSKINEHKLTINFVNLGYPDGVNSIKNGMLPWAHIIEPFKNHEASISSFKIKDVEQDINDYNVKWEFNGQIYFGESINLTSQKTGKYTLSLTLTPTTTSDEHIVDSYFQEFEIISKYIRREIRSLTESDRNTFLNALQKIYTLDETTGKVLYGDKFQTAQYFLAKHLAGAGTTDCDHWHDGAGILVHHMAFTLEVEQALQAINSSISMPYWEYGMDPIIYSDWRDSPIFNSNWFGEANPDTTDHTISEGIWKDIELPDGSPYDPWNIEQTGSLNPFVNGYNKLRSPWNNNPSPKIGRRTKTYIAQQFDTLPSCMSLFDCFASDSLSRLNDCVNGGTHGPVHILIGGAWDREGTEYDDDTNFLQIPDRLLLFKVLWRKGYTRCPSHCPADDDDDTPCKCAVPQKYLDEIGAQKILEDINFHKLYSKHLKDATGDFYLKCLQVVEDPGIAGEMFSSAAAFDPTFWPLHGAAERMVDLKRILVAQGKITDFDNTWGYPDYDPTSAAVYLPGVCDWSAVQGVQDLTLPTCDLELACPGHAADDTLEFSNFLNKGETYTNLGFFEFMHPWNVDLPYTYDTFDYDYCLSQGYDFMESAVTSSSSSSRRSKIE